MEQTGRPRGHGAGGASGAPPVGATDRQAAEALSAGGLVILPTETVYGLAADAGEAAAVAALFEAKGRPRFNPLIAHVADAVEAETIAVFDDRARALAEAFWPGPLTIVAPIRDRFNEQFAPDADAVDGGPCAVGVESTVVSVLDGRVALLRPGSVTREEIEAVVGPLERGGEGHRSPGRTALHYAPDAPVRINADAAAPGEILLGFGPGAGDPRWSLSLAGDLREAAANLFRRLREADRERPVGIAVSPIPPQGLGEAINDRLKRAAGFVG